MISLSVKGCLFVSGNPLQDVFSAEKKRLQESEVHQMLNNAKALVFTMIKSGKSLGQFPMNYWQPEIVALRANY
jgi:hypothetical protein